MPRSLILDCSPTALRPPVTPGTRLSRVAMPGRNRWRSMSSRLITLMLAGASLIHCWLPEAVTTTVSRSLVEASAPASAAARPGRASRQAEARAGARRVRGRRAERERDDGDMAASMGGGDPVEAAGAGRQQAATLPWVVGARGVTGAAGWGAAVRKTVTCLVNEMITVRVDTIQYPGRCNDIWPSPDVIACYLLNGDKSRRRPSHPAYIQRPDWAAFSIPPRWRSCGFR